MNALDHNLLQEVKSFTSKSRDLVWMIDITLEAMQNEELKTELIIKLGPSQIFTITLTGANLQA